MALYTVDSPINREQRKNLNLTFADILRRFANLQMQIKVLAGGEEIDELLQRIEDTITNAQNDVAAAIEANNTATQDAITKNDNATQQAITANNVALQNALSNVTSVLIELEQAIDSANATTAATNIAKDAALQAAQDALTAIETMQTSVQALKDSFVHKSTYNNATQYRKNNEVYYNGSTYRAKKDTLGNPPPTALGVSNDYWQLIARRGEDAPVSSLFGVWRGPTPPTNKQMLWWFDDSLSQGYETQIWVGPTAPDNTNVLWLNTENLGGA